MDEETKDDVDLKCCRCGVEMTDDELELGHCLQCDKVKLDNDIGI